LLEHPDAFQRTHLPGHITGSSWIIDPSGESVLLTHHAKLNKWLQPGGHADGDEDIISVAMREAKKKRAKGLHLATTKSSTSTSTRFRHAEIFRSTFTLIFDFSLQQTPDEPLWLSDESHALAWVHASNLAHLTENNISMLRMAHKVTLLLGADQQ
jgi:8-oxo-dGTP pyrophosphatase MutT (NUDIX family)